jgi:GH35 family endo-1,4-beta-xylanase
MLAFCTNATAELPEAYVKLWRNPELTQQIDRNIEQNRKSDAELSVVGADGAPLKNVTLEISQQRQEFLFGCNLFALDQLPTAELNQKYERYFAQLFNFATVPFYWGDLEAEPGKTRYAEGSPKIWRRPPPDRLVNWCEEHGITPKGHALLYVKNMFMPAWTARDNAETLRKQCAAHMTELAERYREKILIWDVINEEIPRMRHTNEWPIVPQDYLAWGFKEAGRLFPKAKLLINDGTNEAHDTPADYEALIKPLLDQGIRIEGVGMQFHLYGRTGFMSGKTLKPQQLIEVYQRFSRMGLPLYITEITVPGKEEHGEEQQAAIVTDLYRLWFSTPNMAGITWWNLGDGTAFQEENKALGGLLDNEMNPKAAYRELDRLINKEWKTRATVKTDAKGTATFRGFHGKYTARLKRDGRSREVPFELKRSPGKAQIVLKID